MNENVKRIKTKTIIGVITIIIAGTLLGAVVYNALNKGTVQIVVPSQTIKAGEEFTNKNLKIVDRVKDSVTSSSYTNIEDLIGKRALTDISKDEMITNSRVADNQSSSYISNMEDATKNYAIQVAISESNPVEGLSIGDYVSLMASINSNEKNDINTGKIGQKYKVIGINRNDSNIISNITLEVSPTDISKISHILINDKYVVSFVSVGQDSNIKVNGTTEKTLYGELVK